MFRNGRLFKHPPANVTCRFTCYLIPRAAWTARPSSRCVRDWSSFSAKPPRIPLPARKVGVITFSSDAQLVTGGLVPISAFQPPHLVTSGVTRLDLAFKGFSME
jgi:hypothetical protein